MKFHESIAWLVLMLSISFLGSCQTPSLDKETPSVYIKILGIAQDAGYPQAACAKQCCLSAWSNPKLHKSVTSLGLVDSKTNKSWMFEATPDFKFQLEQLQNEVDRSSQAPDGIFITHAHIGHYTGLMHLGREAMGAKEVAVYVMPKMKKFLALNGPWDQLINLKNISIHPLKKDSSIMLTKDIKVVPLLVPHRDEYSETVGFKIFGPERTLLFIPDIDKWELWNHSIIEEVKQVDYALLDGTFYEEGEIPGRNMSDIPHPFINESIFLFKNLTSEDKTKVYFIHMNHTNKLLYDPVVKKELLNLGFNVAEEGMVLKL